MVCQESETRPQQPTTTTITFSDILSIHCIHVRSNSTYSCLITCYWNIDTCWYIKIDTYSIGHFRPAVKEPLFEFHGKRSPFADPWQPSRRPSVWKFANGFFENLPFQFFIQRIYSSCSETHNMTWLSLSTKNMWENQQIQVTSTHQDNFDITVGLDLFSHKRKPSVAIYVNMCQIQTFTCWEVRAVAPSNNKSEDWNTKQVKTC